MYIRTELLRYDFFRNYRTVQMFEFYIYIYTDCVSLLIVSTKECDGRLYNIIKIAYNKRETGKNARNPKEKYRRISHPFV